MNVLTPNRILQKGDEYFDDDKGWKPIPKENFGLQVMFSGYSEVRRPSEPLQKTLASERPISPETTAAIDKLISPKQAAGKNASPVTAEGDKNPVVSHSATGDTPLRETPETAKDEPTEVAKSPVSPTPSRFPAGHFDAPPLKNVPAGEIEKAIEKAKLIGSANGHIKIDFPYPATNRDVPIWTGRNGTFTGYGLDAMCIGENVMLSPIGKRGVGNCAIQFPISVIPELVDWLLRQQK